MNSINIKSIILGFLDLRKAKQFGIISVFNFPNADCTNEDGTAGECYTAQVYLKIFDK